MLRFYLKVAVLGFFFVVPFIFISHFSSVRNNFTRAQGPVIVIAKEEI